MYCLLACVRTTRTYATIWVPVSILNMNYNFYGTCKYDRLSLPTFPDSAEISLKINQSFHALIKKKNMKISVIMKTFTLIIVL